LARLARATAQFAPRWFFTANEAHDLISAQVLELNIEASPHSRGCCLKPCPAILFDVRANWCDDDLATFKAEGNFTARRDSCSLTNVFGDGYLPLLSDEHDDLTGKNPK